MNFYITNPNESQKQEIKDIYIKNRDTLGIPFNRVFDEMVVDKNFFVACEETTNKVIGFCGLKYRPRLKYYEIEHLCVDKEYRKNHVAILMLRYLVVSCYKNKNINKLFSSPTPIVAFAVDGSANNSFYDRLSFT